MVNPPQNICSLIPPTPTLYFDTLVYFSPPQNISSYQPPIKFQEETCGLLSLYLNENATSAIQNPVLVGWYPKIRILPLLSVLVPVYMHKNGQRVKIGLFCHPTQCCFKTILLPP